jgi:hypothetical protein
MLTALAGRIYTKLNLGSVGGWLRSWLFFTLCFALAPILLSTTYYAIAVPSDFGSALGQLRGNDLRRLLRIGTQSSSSSDAGFVSWNFGVNAEDPTFKRGIAEIKDGTLREVRQATYLGWFGDSRWPMIFTLVRSVRSDGEIIFTTGTRQKAPILSDLGFCALSTAVGLLGMNVLNGLNKRKKKAA